MQRCSIVFAVPHRLNLIEAMSRFEAVDPHVDWGAVAAQGILRYIEEGPHNLNTRFCGDLNPAPILMMGTPPPAVILNHPHPAESKAECEEHKM